MYNDIVGIYDQIFPLNQAFLAFIPTYLGEPGSRVLDLGCGPGYYVDWLEEHGFRATGIDNSTEMIRKSQERFRGEFFAYSFTEIRRLRGAFACIFCIGNSLSYLPRAKMPIFCQDVSHLLEAGGYFIVQVVNWDRHRRHGTSDFPVKALADGHTFHRQYVPAENDSVLFKTELRLDGKLLHAWSDVLHPKYAADLQADLTATGLNVLSVCGDYAGSPFDPQSSPATILVAQK